NFAEPWPDRRECNVHVAHYGRRSISDHFFNPKASSARKASRSKIEGQMPFDLAKGCPQRIAIVGGGISGLACAWLLSLHHQVTLYESERRLGGHARTVLAGKRGDQPVDTGFIVFNHVNYPH